MKEVPVIRVSSDYSIFKTLVGNRDFLHKEKVIKSIRKVGYVPSPIICNEKMEVIDGQTRLDACEELQLPVYYIIVPGLRIEHCMSMNISMTNWSMRDFIKSYAKQENKNYCNLLALMEKHPGFSYRVVCSAASETAISVDNDTIKEGRLRISDELVARADEILCWLDENALPFKSRINGRFEYLCMALIFSILHSSADSRRLASTVRDYAYDFTPISSVKHALEQIERFYNRNLKQNRVYFLTEYDKFLVQTNAAYESRWSIAANNKKRSCETA